MAGEKFAVRLTPDEGDQLEYMVRAGKYSDRRVAAQARIPLKTAKGRSTPKVAQALDVDEGTGFRIQRRFSGDGSDGTLKDRLLAPRCLKLDDLVEAGLIALACSPAPEGHDHWNLRLLADRRAFPKGVPTRGPHGGCPGSLRRTL